MILYYLYNTMRKKDKDNFYYHQGRYYGDDCGNTTTNSLGMAYFFKSKSLAERTVNFANTSDWIPHNFVVKEIDSDKLIMKVKQIIFYSSND